MRGRLSKCNQKLPGSEPPGELHRNAHSWIPTPDLLNLHFNKPNSQAFVMHVEKQSVSFQDVRTVR